MQTILDQLKAMRALDRIFVQSAVASVNSKEQIDQPMEHLKNFSRMSDMLESQVKDYGIDLPTTFSLKQRNDLPNLGKVIEAEVAPGTSKYAKRMVSGDKPVQASLCERVRQACPNIAKELNPLPSSKEIIGTMIKHKVRDPFLIFDELMKNKDFAQLCNRLVSKAQTNAFMKSSRLLIPAGLHNYLVDLYQAELQKSEKKSLFPQFHQSIRKPIFESRQQRGEDNIPKVISVEHLNTGDFLFIYKCGHMSGGVSSQSATQNCPSMYECRQSGPQQFVFPAFKE